MEQWLAQNQMVPPQLDEVAHRIKNLYASIRQTMFPRYRVNSTRHDIWFWREVAMSWLDINADVDNIMHLVFDTYGARAYPESLLSNKLLLTYQDKHSENWDKELVRAKAAVIRHTAKVQQRLAEGQELSAILTDTANSFNPAFVWCMAVYNNLSNLSNSYRAAAKQLLSRPAMKKVYTEMFPNAFTTTS